MEEAKAETTETTEKSPGDLAREKVAPEGYSWYENYDRRKPPYPDKTKWLADLQTNDPSIVDLVMGEPAFDNEGNRLQMTGGRAYTSAAYITRELPVVSADPAKPESGSDATIKPPFRQKLTAALHSRRGPTIEKSR